MSSNLKLISLDLKSEMGFFKKPDINDGIYLTYNMIHKPCLLGLLGAIVGLQGYKYNNQLPSYYEALKHINIGIEPLCSDKGNYSKTILSYNNGTGLASDEGNLIVTEQILLKPQYRCYLLLNLDNDIEKRLFDNVISYQAEFLPYMGKNDFSAWWDNVQQYDFVEFDYSKDFKIESIFAKTDAVKDFVKKINLRSKVSELPFFYFEELPIKFNETLFQYEYANFIYTNVEFKIDINLNKIGKLYTLNSNKVIQLF